MGQARDGNTEGAFGTARRGVSDILRLGDERDKTGEFNFYFFCIFFIFFLLSQRGICWGDVGRFESCDEWVEESGSRRVGRIQV